MDRLHNPFTPGAGALPPELAGRAHVIEDGQVLAGRALLGRYEKSLLLIGLRGVGKTVLLKHLADEAGKSGVIPIQVEVRGSKGDIEELLLRLKDALYLLDFSTKVKRGVKYAFSVLRNFVRAFAVNVGDVGLSVEMAQGVASTGNMELDLSEVLKACARAAKESGRAIGLYIDELQGLDIEAMRGIIVALHHAAQESLPIYLVGSGLPSIRSLVGKSKTYAERMFNYSEIGALSAADAEAAVANPMNDNGVRIEAAAVAEIFRITRGYPYFLQEYGYQLWQAADVPQITRETVLGLANVVEARLDDNFFDVRFDRVSNAERAFLRVMADLESEGVVPMAEISKKMGRTAAALSPVRAALIKKGMLYSPQHGEIAFTVPLFGDYMKRAMPEKERSK